MKTVPEKDIAWATKLLARLEEDQALRLGMTEGTAARLVKIIKRHFNVRLLAARHLVAHACGYKNWQEAYSVFVSNSASKTLRVRIEDKASKRSRWRQVEGNSENHISLVDTIIDRGRATKGAYRRHFVERLHSARKAHDLEVGNRLALRRLPSGLATLRIGDLPVNQLAVRVAFRPYSL